MSHLGLRDSRCYELVFFILLVLFGTYYRYTIHVGSTVVCQANVMQTHVLMLR